MGAVGTPGACLNECNILEKGCPKTAKSIFTGLQFTCAILVRHGRSEPESPACSLFDAHLSLVVTLVDDRAALIKDSR